MQAQIDIGFEESVKLVKALPSNQLQKLRSEIDRKTNTVKSEGLELLLLKGPVATKKQLETIESNRQRINRWRHYRQV
ncbi:hypothetical protein [Parapedobacter sp. 2B3]|uniref:hypothetical protein n=1 Tax=Parapedobacter sp. 2B3 TaxID=3342381 RepID=UPI0035B651A8